MMARVIGALLAVLEAPLRYAVTRRVGVCIFRGACDPVKAPVGGFKCSRCGAVGADISDFLGFQGESYNVHPVRGHFTRNKSEFTMSSAWDPDASGRW